MKDKIVAFLIIVLAIIAIIVSIAVTKCIAESDMNPWLKAWFLFGR